MLFDINVCMICMHNIVCQRWFRKEKWFPAQLNTTRMQTKCYEMLIFWNRLFLRCRFCLSRELKRLTTRATCRLPERLDLRKLNRWAVFSGPRCRGTCLSKPWQCLMTLRRWPRGCADLASGPRESWDCPPWREQRDRPVRIHNARTCWVTLFRQLLSDQLGRPI